MFMMNKVYGTRDAKYHEVSRNEHESQLTYYRVHDGVSAHLRHTSYFRPSRSVIQGHETIYKYSVRAIPLGLRSMETTTLYNIVALTSC